MVKGAGEGTGPRAVFSMEARDWRHLCGYRMGTVGVCCRR